MVCLSHREGVWGVKGEHKGEDKGEDNYNNHKDNKDNKGKGEEEEGKDS